MDYKDFEIPKNLKFKMEDIIALKGFEGSFLANVKDFADIFPEEEKLKKITLKLKMSVLSKDILIKGEVSGILEVPCSRCLKRFEKPFKEEINTLTSKRDKIIDIMYITRQTLPLVVGIQDLCSENCKGLCPICGTNLNEKQCNCEEEKFSPFACLKDKFK
ncbi:MAG: DUF177 domain-containing protein [Elusimicrobiaceae bacterium]|nr:DUF177 domain-containing protein [Elusimicrobiaceae bacterium]